VFNDKREEEDLGDIGRRQSNYKMSNLSFICYLINQMLQN